MSKKGTVVGICGSCGGEVMENLKTGHGYRSKIREMGLPRIKKVEGSFCIDGRYCEKCGLKYEDSSLEKVEKEEGQLKIFYLKVYDPEEMGVVLSKDPSEVYLDDYFIDKLPRYEGFIGQTSNIQCPFCREGFLRLKNMEPMLHGDSFGREHHVGDSFEYDCTKKDCEARFNGHIKWMNIM